MKLILSLLLFTTLAFGAFTPFPPAPVAGNSIVTKGGLLSSDGTNQSEVAACADGKILEFDSGELFGLTCGDKTVDTDTNAGTLCTSGQYLDGDGACKTEVVDTNAGTICASGELLNGDGACQTIPSGSSGPTVTYSSNVFASASSLEFSHVTRFSDTITIGPSGELEIDLVSDTNNFLTVHVGNSSCSFRLLIGGVNVWQRDKTIGVATYWANLPMRASGLGAGSKSVAFQLKNGNSSCQVQGRFRYKTW